jgi:hypothetical protein
MDKSPAVAGKLMGAISTLAGTLINRRVNEVGHLLMRH